MKHVRSPLARCRIIVALSLGLVTSAFASPLTSVRDTIEAVIETLAAPGLEDASRRRQALDLIAARFDFESMTRRTLATNWNRADAVQQARLVSLFHQLLINTYWQRLAAYRGERVEVLGEEIREAGFATVRTIIRSTADIPVDYKLELTAGRWLAYDVVIEQVSLVRNYRGTFLDEVHRAGIDGLIRYLETRVAETESPSPREVSVPAAAAR